jgi:ribonuclease HIII
MKTDAKHHEVFDGIQKFVNYVAMAVNSPTYNEMPKYETNAVAS